MRRCNRLLCLYLAVCLFCLSGCFVAWDPDFAYRGENTELVATAVYSLLGVESDDEDQITILDRDEYGRVLFAYCAHVPTMVKRSFEECLVAVLIMQKCDDAYVYFYAEQNYLLATHDAKINLEKSSIESFFTDDMISKLKEKNDWGISPEYCSAKMEKAPSSVEKRRTLSKQADKVISAQIGSNYRYAFFREDISGNEIWFILLIKSEGYQWYVIMLDESGNLTNGDLSILCLDKDHTTEIPGLLQSFMVENKWNKIAE